MHDRLDYKWDKNRTIYRPRRIAKIRAMCQTPANWDEKSGRIRRHAEQRFAPRKIHMGVNARRYTAVGTRLRLDFEWEMSRQECQLAVKDSKTEKRKGELNSAFTRTKDWLWEMQGNFRSEWHLEEDAKHESHASRDRPFIRRVPL